MECLKPTVRSLLGGVFSPLGKFYAKNKLTIFVYHDISKNSSEFSYKYDLNIPPDIFEWQIDFINRNFNVISPDNLLARKIPENAAIITFDDGFRSYFSTAIPILQKYTTPSIIFLNMAPIKGEIFWSGLITYLCDKFSDFHHHIVSSTKCDLNEKPLFLYCSRAIVNMYLEKKGKTFKEEVNEFVGEFATLKDLESVSSNNLVFFGNHLYNHDIPLLLSDDEILESYNKNELELKRFPNYRNIFAFPFGQPKTCYSKRQIELLIENGAKKVFSAYPIINSEVTAQYLHRIPLQNFNNTKSRIWFNILRAILNYRIGNFE